MKRNFYLKLFLLVAPLLSFVVHATAATITANASGQWKSTGTWTGNQIPTTGDIAIIPAGITVTYTTAALSGTGFEDWGNPTIAVYGTLLFFGDTDHEAGINLVNAANISVFSGGAFEDNTYSGGFFLPENNTNIYIYSGANYIVGPENPYTNTQYQVTDVLNGQFIDVGVSGNNPGPFTINSDGTEVALINSAPSAPVISTTGSLSALSTTFGTASSAESFNISSSNLGAGNITVTAPTGFDVSADNITWSGSGGNFIIAETGTLSSQVYVRLDAGDAVNSYSGNVSISGGGASTVTEAIPSSTVAAPSTTISAITPNSAISKAGTITYTVTFAASVSTLGIANFAVNPSSGVTGASVASMTGSGASYTVTVNTGSGDGTLALNMVNSTNVTPSVSNLTFTGGTTVIDKTSPTIAIGAPLVTYASSSTSVVYTVTYADANFNSSTLAPGNISLNGSGASGTIGVTGSGATRTVTISSITGNGTLGISIAAGTATDLAGNSAPASSPSATFIVDNTPPTAAISAPSATSIGNNGSGSVSYTITYADANFNTSDLTNAGITLNTSGTANGTYNVTGAGTSYTVTISGITGAGTLGINLAGGFASDLAGNTDLGAGPSTTFNVVSSDATLSNLSVSQGSLNPVFSLGTTAYADSVGHTITSITVTPTTSDPGATAVVTINGNPGNTGSLNIGDNAVVVTVTAADGVTTDTYTVRVGREGSHAAGLANLSVSGASISPSFATATTSYTANVTNRTQSVTIIPSVIDPTSTVTVDGVLVANQTASGPIALNVGSNAIPVVVTAQDGGTTRTYTLTVNRPESSNANLVSIGIDKGYLVPGFTAANTSYNVSVGNGASTISLTPTTADPTASVIINGSPVISGTTSGPVGLNVGSNNVPVLVTAQDGSQKTYTLIITRAPSNDAYLASMSVSDALLSPNFAFTTLNYTASVPNQVRAVTLTANVLEPNATFTVNTSPATPKVASALIPLTAGANTVITIVVTAQDNSTTQTYTVTIARAAGTVDSFDPGISVTKPTETPLLADDGILVHQGISPNGDGINDFLQIDNISQYPDNRLAIMNRNGQLIYEAKGYDNSSRLFDGHSNKNGQMQLPGTYFYQLDYTVSGITKHKTGFLVLKY